MTMVNLNVNDSTLWGRNPAARQSLVRELVEHIGVVVTRKQVIAFLDSTGRSYRDTAMWLFNDRRFRAARGSYTLQPLIADGSNTTDTATVPQGASLS